MNPLGRQKSTPVVVQLVVDGSNDSIAAKHLLGSLPLPPGSQVTALGVVRPRQSPAQDLLAMLDETKMHLQGNDIQVNVGLLYGNPDGLRRSTPPTTNDRWR
jgi:hypothetical protein